MNKREIGAIQEEKVCDALRGKGYEILERNYRCRLGEIDMIARHKGYLVFIEVKYRKTDAMGYPEEAVGKRKQTRISRVSAWYLIEQGLDSYTPCRYDVVAVSPGTIRIYENAFNYLG